MSPDPEKAPQTGAKADESSVETLDPADVSTVARLKAEKDIPGLLELAAAYFSGTDTVERSLDQALACYGAAAQLGSSDGEYGIALFHMSSSLAGEDWTVAVRHLRRAAEMGHVKARMYLGNLYELGMHYDADSEKASVWYRGAARAAEVELEPGTPGYSAAMAELGCVRETQVLIADESIPKDKRLEYLRKAKALGYAKFLREQKRREEALRKREEAEAAAKAAEDSQKLLVDAQTERDEQEEALGIKRPEVDDAVKRELDKRDEEVTTVKWTVGRGLGAILMMLVLVTIAGGAGWLAQNGARATFPDGLPIPGLADRFDLILPVVLGALAGLPSFLLYRAGTVIGASFFAALTAVAGWLVFTQHWAQLLPTSTLQATAFGVAGFLLVVLWRGMRGGTRGRRPEVTRPQAPGSGGASPAG